MTRRYRNAGVGFTLLELMLVVGILLVLSTVGVVAWTRIAAGIRKKAALTLVKNTEVAVVAYHNAMNSYPDDDPGLGALIDEPDDDKEAQVWREEGGPFLEDRKIPVDPWRSELKYMKIQTNNPSERQFRVYSFGPNKTDDNGGEDDIPKWAEEAG